jgi:outer membrane murein-binding lipoprotein Lpp
MTWVAIVLAVLLLAGCGGKDRGTQPSSPRQGVEADRAGEPDAEGEEEGGGGLPSISRADRHAFVQIGVAIGELNVVSGLAVKHVERRRDTVVLKRLRSRVADLRPRDRQLAGLRAQVLAALDRAIRARRGARSARRSAPATLAAVARILKGLRGYQSSHPAIGAMVPD